MRTRTYAPDRLPHVVAIAVACLIAGVGLAAAQPPAQPPPAQAAPAASLDDILTRLAAYDGGVESAAMWQLRDYVWARRDDAAGRAECETALVRFLASPATPAARVAAARFLRTFAGDTAVPALLALVADNRTADQALYALQGIPGREAESGLIKALATASGPTRTAIIAALGERRAAAALPVVVPLLRDPAFGVAAATAVGRIGGADAAVALLDALPAVAPDRRPAIAAALLETADALRRANDVRGAQRVFDAVLTDASLPVPLRRTAAAGRLAVAGSPATALLLDMLSGSDPASREAAASRIVDIFTAETIGAVAERLPKLAPDTRVQVIAALATYPAARVVAAVRAAADDTEESVRLAALKALAVVGDASLVPFLAGRAASARGPEQAVARAALGALPGRASDDAILALLGGKPDDALAGELLAAVAERRLYVAKPLVAAALSLPSRTVRSQALRTLRVIGTPSDLSTVLGLLATAEDAERDEVERTVGALARMAANPETRGRLLRMRLMNEKSPDTRARLLAVLPQLGDDGMLPLVRAAAGDADAGVRDAGTRALASWPSVAARDDLIVLARTAPDETHRLLALVGFIRLVAADPHRRPEAAVEDLKLAAALASRTEEKTLVLGAAGNFPCKAALELATGMLRDPSVKAEAQAAIDKITPRLSK